jgi:hypothetical protein
MVRSFVGTGDGQKDRQGDRRNEKAECRPVEFVCFGELHDAYVLSPDGRLTV